MNKSLLKLVQLVKYIAYSGCQNGRCLTGLLRAAIFDWVIVMFDWAIVLFDWVIAGI